MEFKFVEPSGFLKLYIKHYCFMESVKHETDICERVIPLDYVQLMFHYKSPFVVLHPDDNLIIHQPQSIISGLNNSFSDVSTFGETGVIFVAFHPVGACCFFDFPLSEIENLSIDMADIFSKEIKQVEDLVNQKIKEDLPVEKKEMTYQEAVAKGALAFFKEKYPDKVSVYSVAGFSKEICAGPHAERTSQLGNFKIIKEESSSAGVRRIKAVLQ